VSVPGPAVGGRPGRSRLAWARSLPQLTPHIVRTTPWATLIAGCASGTLILAVMAHFADHSAISQSTVRVTVLPAVAAFAFVPHVHFRPLVQATPLPTWIIPVGQVLLALPLLAVTCWLQVRLMSSTVPAQSRGHLPAVYPLLAQVIGWTMLTLSFAACCERTRYAALSGAVAVPVSMTVIAISSFTPAIQRHLLTPPAAPYSATLWWYAIAATAAALNALAIRDQWHRYGRRLHRQPQPSCNGKRCQ
jgi:hypothetical protein